MGYRVVNRSSFRQDVKGFKKQADILAEAQQKVAEIIENPAIGEFLVGSWVGFQKVSFHNKPQIRLIYRVYPCCRNAENQSEDACIYEEEPNEECSGLIDFLFLKTREECNNLYAQRKSYSDGFIR